VLDMSDTSAENGRTLPASARGDRTRDRLLDSLETIAAESGIAALSHRVVARRAQLNTGLIHYHFGTIDQLLEQALARRAARLSRAQVAAIQQATGRGHWIVEDVIDALWRPFSALGSPLEDGWRNYLCLIARLASDTRGNALLERYFDDVTRAAHRALRSILPAASDDLVATGLRFTRALFEQEALSRCNKTLGDEERSDDDRRLVAYAAAGMRALAGAQGATGTALMSSAN
jgi:AcrR family transcriptional regulator